MRVDPKRWGSVVLALGLFALSGSSVGLAGSYAPIRLQANCSADLGDCWETHGLNKDNVDQVMDLCWQETKKCPKVCRDQYRSHREAGMKAPVADDLVLFGKPSCIPGLDEEMKPSRKDKDNAATGNGS